MLTETDFGRIEFTQSERARSIRVRILPDCLKVTLPDGVSQAKAMDFIRSEKEKILSKQKKLIRHEENNPTLLTEDSVIKTLTFDVHLNRSQRENIHFSMHDGKLKVDFPINLDHNSHQSQKHIWNGINFFLRKEAKRLLPDRTRQLALKHGFFYTSVKIQPSKSRWGSCSREKSINLSFYLMLLPTHLIDYVILHELCHTKEMNHGEKFWMWMDKVTNGKTNELRSELKKHHMPR